MAAFITRIGIVLPLFVYFMNGEDLKSTVVFSPAELIRDSHLVNNSLKLALRYGFQKTSECSDFSKAFICVQKCLDLGFDVAHSNRHCYCTCYHKKGKAKSSTPHILHTKTKWRLGAPTTRLPVWATTSETDVKLKKNETADIQYVLIEGNMSDIVNDIQAENITLETETLATDEIVNKTDVPGEVTTDKDADNLINATVAKEDEESQTGGTGNPKDEKQVTGTGNANERTQDSGNASGGTDSSGMTSSNNNRITGGPENSQPVTKENDAISGGTEKPKQDTEMPTTGA